MSVTAFNIFDLETEWQNAPDGFLGGFDFKTWLAANVIQLRDRIAWLTTTIGEDGLAAINRLIAACDRGDINQIAAPDLGIARDEILDGREAIEQARPFVELAKQELWYRSRPEDYAAADAWLAAHPAPCGCGAEQEQAE